jgi:hypothetical protein
MITKTIPVQWAIQTGGDGLWSSRSAIVEVTSLTIKWEGGNVVEINVSFDPNTWNVEHYGLIYTDELFRKAFQDKLSELCGNNTIVDYTEQGMQGEDYISMECCDLYPMMVLLDPKPQEIIEEMERYYKPFQKEMENKLIEEEEDE